MRLVVKIGGAQLEQPAARACLARAVAGARSRGHELLLVHGGGNQIRALAGRLALPQRYVDGLRVTDAATAEVATAVLAGQVNKQLVAALTAAGVGAVGVCGADGSCMTARVHRPGGADLGYVGAVHRVEPHLLRSLWQARLVPVVATVAPLATGLPGPRDQLYNINADMAAGPLAAALDADAVLFLSDVDAVLDGDGQPVRQLDPRGEDALRGTGVIRGGMLPKIAAARDAHAIHGVALVVIASANGEDAIARALRPDCGTRIAAASATDRA